MHELFSLLAGIIYVGAFVPYISAVFMRQAQPVKSTWIIWATLDAMVLVGMYQSGTMNYQIAGATLGATCVALLSLRYGVSGWSKLDKICLIVAAVGIVLWNITGSALLGMLIGLALILTGSLPTIKSAYEDPSRENKTAWLMYLISCVFMLAAVPAWTLEHALQPIVFTVIEASVVFLIIVRPARSAS